MANGLERLAVDCSVIVKWKIPTEDDAAAAKQLMLDWEHGAVAVWAPYLLQSEVMSAFLRAYRRERISADEARAAIQDLLALPFVLVDVASMVERAFAIALQHQHRAPHVLHMQKALLQMNIQLSQALSDVTGATGQRILCAMVAGERALPTRVALRNYRSGRPDRVIMHSLSAQSPHRFACPVPFVETERPG